jgi:hypothetical protein
MRKLFTISFAFTISLFLFNSCKKEVKQDAVQAVSKSVLDKISKLGFSTQDVAVHEDGFLVEGDIIIPEAQLDAIAETQFLRVGSEEQYRTNNVVTGLPRTITISMSSKLSASYSAALNEAIARYNAQSLLITFTRVPSGGNIVLAKGNGNYLASAGFPSGGQPYSQVKVNTNAIGNQPQATVASIIAHEIGHCIGFRHTDYMNRQYSCGGSPVNEGASTVGAVHIPGTPTGPDPNSWMLSCIGSGQNRPFNTNDKTALAFIY